MPYLARINGFGYKEEYNARQNTLTIGKAQIQKWHAYLMDTWQYDKDTIFTPIVRLDHSTLFGSHVTAGVGMTHNVGGNPHRRFKANVGTGYAEPGMGELYYNWEMYPAMSEHAPGWYWVGNAQLKPEKSVNLSLSLEGETKNTFARVSIFHNRIKDYLTHYFSGHYPVSADERSDDARGHRRSGSELARSSLFLPQSGQCRDYRAGGGARSCIQPSLVGETRLYVPARDQQGCGGEPHAA
ncbi:hypothetical protein HMPREF0080_01296 [Anaeroglobus geminatus F0357]|uniref:TonB-dependent receptor-like beta-barrel domain-containing protein n=2 Tax=Anaeroglobus TaxID=156454 RepID=G9YI12_9FIRM|nr:hypothetical protein HMPREF0080_01296 [Anaeroglobus geminatus F0357]